MVEHNKLAQADKIEGGAHLWRLSANRKTTVEENEEMRGAGT